MVTQISWYPAPIVTAEGRILGGCGDTVLMTTYDDIMPSRLP
jgi:hypothetical protein